jgi:predicted nucleotidyltransferase
MPKITEININSIKDTLARDKERLAAKYHLSEIGVFGSYTGMSNT